MITDLNVQHELVKTALLATDNYLGIEKKTIAAGSANANTLREFTNFYNVAYQALMSLGVLDQHEEYMKTHLQTMWKYAKEEDTTLADDPYSSTPGGAVGGVDESKEFWDSAKDRADKPHEKLSPEMKAKARARAAAAGRKYPNMVDNVWAAQKQEAVISSFANFLAEKKEEFTEADINEMVDSLTWDDMIDMYPEEDLIEEEAEQLDEKLSAQARLKKRQSFARGKGKRSTAKSIKLRRASTPETLQKRAQLAARRSMYAKMLRGRDKATLSASEKDRIEQQVSRMKNIQSSIAVRMVPKMRAIEQKRLAHYRGGSKK
ncbi:hypothetical protein UFOVP242_63 [uncultured Caudovirales phage]|uniref:Uncharacterized protein n=1 Tax=uncultured Caudovirales phage TaxID=2100421 RepID=A0A6J7WY04_9CAUD|nr:hypothetical protein UFOVP242_63 [uncultured Caudovirales phage]